MKGRIQSALSAAALAVTLMLLVSVCSLAEEDGSPVSIGTYRTLRSEVLDEDRTILVNLPRGYEKSAVHYPVLFVLYGGQVRGYFAETVHVTDRLHEAGLIPRLIVVGVKNVDRYRDNLPVNRNGERGGADKFLRFFDEELIPFVDESYRTKDFRILVGPQAGASFGLYALMERPGLFRVNMITNPFWNSSVREYLLAMADGFFNREGPLESFLFITCNTGADSEATMEYLDKLAGVVEEGRRNDFVMVMNPLGEEEKDGTIPSPGLKKGLPAYFKGYKLPEDAEVDGLDDLKQYYRVLSERYGYEVNVPEVALIRQGDRLQRSGGVEEAEVIYEYVVEQYPHNLNSYLRLAELYRSQGNYGRSIDYYERFLERRQEPFIEQQLTALQRYVDESAAYAVEVAIIGSGIDAGVTKYRELRADDGADLYFSESEFNSLGYALVARGMPGAAIEVFKMNVEMNPESANAYDSLGEAYLMHEDVPLAVESYKRSLELDPANDNAREVLKTLGEEGD